MSFIDYGRSKSKTNDVLDGINRNKFVKLFRWITLVLFFGLPIIYMVLAIVFKWDALFQFAHDLGGVDLFIKFKSQI